jgi:hypothetical protein
MSPKTNPLDIPEILCMVGRFLVETSEVASMQVSKNFHRTVAATSWESVVVDYENRNLYRETDESGRLLPWESLKLYGSNVRSVSFSFVATDSDDPPKE